MARIYNPQNHLGKHLVPAGTTKPTSVDTIDISWLTVADTYDAATAETNNKVVSTKGLKDAITKIDTKIENASKLHFKVIDDIKELTNLDTGTYAKITAENYDTICTTIFLVLQSSITGAQKDANDTYIEYVCTNSDKYVEETHGETGLAAKYEALGYINNVVVPATESSLGSVQILDDLTKIKEGETNPVVPTVGAVKTVTDGLRNSISDLESTIEGAIDEAKEELEGTINSEIASAKEELEKSIDTKIADALENFEAIDDLRDELSSTTITVTKTSEHPLTAGKGSVSQNIETGEEFSAAYLDTGDGYVLCMPEVTVSGTTMNVQMFEDTDTIPQGTKLKIVTTIIEASLGDFTNSVED